MRLQGLAAPFVGVGKEGAEMNTQGAMGGEGTRGVSLKHKPNGPDLPWKNLHKAANCVSLSVK